MFASSRDGFVFNRNTYTHTHTHTHEALLGGRQRSERRTIRHRTTYTYRRLERQEWSEQTAALHFRHAYRYVPRTSDAGPAERVQRVPHYFRARRLYLSTGLKLTNLIDFSTLFMTTLTIFPGDLRLANPSSKGRHANAATQSRQGKLPRWGPARRERYDWLPMARFVRSCVHAANGAVGVCGGSFFVRAGATLGRAGGDPCVGAWAHAA